MKFNLKKKFVIFKANFSSKIEKKKEKFILNFQIYIIKLKNLKF